jgi:acyl-CoA synthetase (AMP-forming)/AMP-acid ligase II
MSESAIVNVASHLSAMAAREPDRSAVCIRDIYFRPWIHNEGDELSFGQLDTISGQIARGLSEIGIVRGVRTALMVPPSFEFFLLTFALFKVGAVPVLVDPGMGIRNLGKCLAEAEPAGFIGIPKAQIARRVLGWARDSIRITVTTNSRLFGGRFTMGRLRRIGRHIGPLPIADTRANETAAIMFTSGSTGIAKGVVYTHGIFAAQVEYLKSIYAIEPGEIDICTFPLFALFAPALGMTAVIPNMNPSRPAKANPQSLVELIKLFGATNLFASPAIIDRVGRYAEKRGIRLPTLRRAISAGAPVSATVVQRFSAMLSPGVQLFTPYGATEALPVANIGSDEILKETRHLTDRGRGVCVGRPVAGMDVRIVPISDEPVPQFDPAICLPPNQVGEIAVSGPVVTAEYFGRPQATALAKMRDPSGRLWHRMGDVGYLDDRGRLWFCGRKSHRVETPMGTLFTDQVEPIFNQVPGMLRSALVGVKRNDITYPVICYELGGEGSSRPAAEIDRDLREAARRFEHTREIEVFLEYPRDFPVDVRHNSKIFREKLARWVDTEMAWVRIPPDRPGDRT